MMRIEMRHYRGGRLVHDGRYSDWGRFVTMLSRRRELLELGDRIEVQITEVRNDA